MRELPILFNGEMVRAILDGRKVETRRPVKPRDGWVMLRCPSTGRVPLWCLHDASGDVVESAPPRSPFGSPGDLLYVRERTRVRSVKAGHASITYDADGSEYVTHVPPRLKPLVPGRCMANGCYKEASRIWLRVLEVRVERVQEITEEGARAEGILDGGCLNCGEPEPCGCDDPQPDARDAFAHLWMSIYGDESWHRSDWVSPCRFEVVSTTGKPA